MKVFIKTQNKQLSSCHMGTCDHRIMGFGKDFRKGCWGAVFWVSHKPLACVFMKFHHSLCSSHHKLWNLATDASLTADPGVASWIPAQSHTFVEIVHEIISTVILLPSAESFKKGCWDYSWELIDPYQRLSSIFLGCVFWFVNFTKDSRWVSTVFAVCLWNSFYKNVYIHCINNKMHTPQILKSNSCNKQASKWLCHLLLQALYNTTFVMRGFVRLLRK